MNNNQYQTFIYRKQCLSMMRGIVALVEKLFHGEIPWVVSDAERIMMQGFLFKKCEPNWSIQVDSKDWDTFVDKYSNPEYYGLLSNKVREYKLKNRYPV